MIYLTLGNFILGSGILGLGETIISTSSQRYPIRPILTNQRFSPYITLSNDFIHSKIEVYNKNRLLNISGLPIEFWLNHTGTWTKVADFTTTRYGTQNIYYSCGSIPDIDCCLGFAKITIDNIVYNTNNVRFNFIKKQEYHRDIQDVFMTQAEGAYADWQDTFDSDTHEIDTFGV